MNHPLGPNTAARLSHAGSVRFKSMTEMTTFDPDDLSYHRPWHHTRHGPANHRLVFEAYAGDEIRPRARRLDRAYAA